jgi:hypothetical protein
MELPPAAHMSALTAMLPRIKKKPKDDDSPDKRPREDLASEGGVKRLREDSISSEGTAEKRPREDSISEATSDKRPREVSESDDDFESAKVSGLKSTAQELSASLIENSVTG